MEKRTALYDQHRAMGGKLVDFAGWEMPLHYGSQLEEHHAVRRSAGMFDVSHMTILELRGARVREFLRHLLANDVARLQHPGKALYSCMCDEQGGILDDLIVYFLDEQWFRMVVNAATHDKDLAWITRQAEAFEVAVEERTDLSMIAVQGPRARMIACGCMSPAQARVAEALELFYGAEVEGLFAARTGYTGEDGFELMVPADAAPALWQALAAAGVRPCGLGARDTLRLEAGMNLYGTDMDEATTPLESGLAWTVAWNPPERSFVGRPSLERQREVGVERKLVGLVLREKGVLRGHQRVVVAGVGEGETTSGSFSPTLGLGIALARVPSGTGAECQVEVRGRLLTADVVRPPFVRNGQRVYKA